MRKFNIVNEFTTHLHLILILREKNSLNKKILTY